MIFEGTKNQFFFGLGLTRAGQTQPDADTLLVLCKIYKIDNILETFGYQPPSEELLLSKEEHELIQKYRQHEEMQNAVKKLLGVGED